MFGHIVLFIVGFFILTKGASILVKEGSSLARLLGVSGLVIGTLVAGIGTSIPEFAVMFFANLTNENAIGLGAIIGSNIFNLLFIIGLCAFFYPLYFQQEWIKRDLVWNIGAILVTAGVAAGGIIGRIEGLVMVVLCVIWIISIARNSNGPAEKAAREGTLLLSVLFALLGLLGVLAGSYFVVEGAVAIAKNFGVSEAFVGLLVVGIGTSLPEITVSLTAAAHRQYGIALGNIIGSNVFDFLGIIGISALARPVFFEQSLFMDLAVAVGAAVFIVILAISNNNHRLGRWHGIFLLALFAMYFVFVVGRG